MQMEQSREMSSPDCRVSIPSQETEADRGQAVEAEGG